MNFKKLSRGGKSALAFALGVAVFVSSAAAQTRRDAGRYADKLIKFSVSEITLESIDFRNQTALMGIGLEISNPLPIKLKDFDYSLRLYGLETIAGSYDGEMKLGGKNASHVNLPVEINLRSIPGVIWTAFKNRGRLKFDLDTAFTLPLFVFEKRFDKSFSGEVPLKSLVDAATMLRASRLGI
ncbi:MAG TPA: LEA type 2 family protein [Blastocatellia bacterium]|nr:LEA type 2 family protein [Blastocatellia bacterium]